MDPLTYFDVIGGLLVVLGLVALVLQLVGAEKRTKVLAWVQAHAWVLVCSVALVGVATWLLLW